MEKPHEDFSGESRKIRLHHSRKRERGGAPYGPVLVDKKALVFGAGSAKLPLVLVPIVDFFIRNPELLPNFHDHRAQKCFVGERFTLARYNKMTPDSVLYGVVYGGAHGPDSWLDRADGGYSWDCIIDEIKKYAPHQLAAAIATGKGAINGIVTSNL